MQDYGPGSLLTSDHDHNLCNSFISFMADQRIMTMRDRGHIMIELLATIHEAKGWGAGTMLLRKVGRGGREGEPSCLCRSERRGRGFLCTDGFQRGEEGKSCREESMLSILWFGELLTGS